MTAWRETYNYQSQKNMARFGKLLAVMCAYCSNCTRTGKNTSIFYYPVNQLDEEHQSLGR